MRFLLTQPRRLTWRVVVSAALVFGYLALVGEGIHCQYFPQAQAEHHHSSSGPVSHPIHCLVANHGTAVTIHSAVFSPIDLLHPVGVLVTRNQRIPDWLFVASGTARAPPTV